MVARKYSNIAVATTLASGITGGASSLTVVDASGYPSVPFAILIDEDTVNEELCIVNAKSGAVFSSLTRGFGGTSAVAHNGGVSVKLVSVAEDHALIWNHVHTGAGGDDTTPLSHLDLTNVGTDDHHAEAHTVASHSDTAATGAQLTELTDGSQTTLHSHAGVGHTHVEADVTDLAHSDPDAIHDNVAGEINAITSKGALVDGDIFLIEDSAASNAKKKVAASVIDDYITASAESTPTGVISGYGGSSAPSGWLLCDGAEISRATFAALFAVIGTTFGVGDGSTTFDLPDLKQRFPIGKADAGVASVLGETGGAVSHTHTGPNHQHTGPSHTHTGPSHTHTMGTHTHTGPSHTHTVDPPSTASDSQGSHTHTMGTHTHFVSDTTSGPSSTTSVDSGIFTAAAPAHTHSTSDTSSAVDPGDTNSGGAHTHTTNIGAFFSASDGTGNTGATDPGDTNASGTGATGADGTGLTGLAGTGATGSNNPPYLTINFIIKT